MLRYLFQIVILFWLALASSAQAEEIISSFDSVLTVQPDGMLTVTETIHVKAEGTTIEHGLYRDFSRHFLTPRGDRGKVSFDIISVKRDGEPETWTTERIDGGTRLWIGDEYVPLSSSEHIYQINYRTDRQFRFGAASDNLVWNVTGTGWKLPIQSATASVMLPEGHAPQDARTKTEAAFASISGDKAFFETTGALDRLEGFPISVGLPKGAVAQPSDTQMAIWWWRDNLSAVIGLTGIAVIFFYFLTVWHHIGRDPQAGRIVPRVDIPENVSPALADYIYESRLSRDGKLALAASAVDLAVNGYVILAGLDRTMSIQRTVKARPETLSAEQILLLDVVEAHDGGLIFHAGNYETLESLLSNFRIAVEAENGERYFRPNRLAFFIGLLGSIGVAVAWYFASDLPVSAAASLSFSCFIPLILNIIGWNMLKARRRSQSDLKRLFCMLGTVTVALTGLAATLVFWSTFERETGSLDILAMIGVSWGLVTINQVFFVLNGATTISGAQIKDHIAGLRLYLMGSEQDRMNAEAVPTMSPAHFETLLPYALVLGLEKPWRRKFDAWFSASLSTMTTIYSPGWYEGDLAYDHDWSFTDTIEAAFDDSSDSDSGSSASSGGGGW